MNKRELLHKLQVSWVGNKTHRPLYGWCLKNWPENISKDLDETLMYDFFIVVYNLIKASEKDDYSLKTFYNYWNSKIKHNFLKNYFKAQNTQKRAIQYHTQEYIEGQVQVKSSDWDVFEGVCQARWKIRLSVADARFLEIRRTFPGTCQNWWHCGKCKKCLYHAKKPCKKELNDAKK